MNPKRAYQEAAVRGASPVRLTILLYDQLVQDVSRATAALKSAQIEQCAQQIGHGIAVIGYLQATLRYDTGRDVARNLGRFYTMLREKLMEAQVRSSQEILGEVQTQLLEVRAAWVKVEAETATTERA
ncbi:MAG TPA: flagellar export chaperone FliS [Terriglobales bacterium]|nr:flagellar export chaperone FliS [Terriglobales bacterium]